MDPDASAPTALTGGADPLPVVDLTADVAEAFVATRGHAPVSVARAPGRVNLVGEHTDYLGGLCLPVALPYATWVAYAPRTDDLVVLSSDAAPGWRGRADDRSAGWHRYVLGALHEAGHHGGADVHAASSVPLGAGLSSSAALICAVLRAASDRSNAALVQPAVRAEVDHVGAPTGGMDQTVSLLAEPRHALLLDFGAGTHEQVPWRPEDAGLELLVVDTGVQHGNADGRFARLRAQAEAAMAATPPLADPVLARRRRHVDGENARVRSVVAAAARGDWTEVGAMLSASHVSLRDDHEVSCAELDVAVGAASDAGALGARMTGGGFGGSCLALVPQGRSAAVRGAVTAAFDARGWARPRFLRGNASGPAVRCS